MIIDNNTEFDRKLKEHGYEHIEKSDNWSNWNSIYRRYGPFKILSYYIGDFEWINHNGQNMLRIYVDKEKYAVELEKIFPESYIIIRSIHKTRRYGTGL